jgi:hypothetical protein
MRLRLDGQTLDEADEVESGADFLGCFASAACWTFGHDTSSSPFIRAYPSQFTGDAVQLESISEWMNFDVLMDVSVIRK